MQTADSHAQHQLSTLAQQTHAPLSALTQQIQSAQLQQECSQQSLLEMVGSTVAGLQRELEEERSARWCVHGRISALLAQL